MLVDVSLIRYSREVLSSSVDRVRLGVYPETISIVPTIPSRSLAKVPVTTQSNLSCNHYGCLGDGVPTGT